VELLVGGKTSRFPSLHKLVYNFLTDTLSKLVLYLLWLLPDEGWYGKDIVVPTVLRVDGHRFFFYRNEGSEPPHIHVQKAEKYAKFWLTPLQLADSIGYTSKELQRIQSIIAENVQLLQEAWNEHFAQ
jgi:Domain of unknown function (DUF4160)